MRCNLICSTKKKQFLKSHLLINVVSGSGNDNVYTLQCSGICPRGPTGSLVI